MSFTKSVYHIVFGTKNRKPIIDIEYEKLVYKLLYDIINNLGGHTYRIGGMPDYIQNWAYWSKIVHKTTIID